MKIFEKIFIVAVLAASTVLANTTIYETNFDSMPLGSIITSQANWVSVYGAESENACADVVEGGYDGSAKCLRMRSQNSAMLGIHCQLSGTEGHSSTNNFRVSFMVNVTTPAALNFNSNDGLGELQIAKVNDYSYKIAAPNIIPFNSTNYCETGVWVPISYDMNSTPGNFKLLRFQFGDCLYEDLNLSIGGENARDYFPNLRFFNWGNTDLKIDNLKIELVPRDLSDIGLSFSGDDSILLNSTSATVKVFNEGSRDATFTVTSPRSWLKINGSTSYELNLAQGANATLNITVDRTSIPNDYFRVPITFTSGSYTAAYPIFVQAGSPSAGYTYYRSYFDNFEEGTDIRVADKAWVNGYGAPDNSPIVSKDGSNAVQINYKAATAFHIRAGIAEGMSQDFNYRVSCRLYIPSGYDKYSQYNIGDGNIRFFELLLNGNSEEGFGLASTGLDGPIMGHRAEADTWFDLSYTFNANPENLRLISVTFDGVTSNLNYRLNTLYDITTDAYGSLRWFGWCSAESAPMFMKDLVIEAVPRESSGPELEVGKGKQVFLNEDTAELTVFNAGNGTLDFQAEVTQGGAWLTIREASEATGILEDSIVGSGSKKYTLDISREDLGNAYGYGQVTVTGAGSSKTVNYYVQSGDETGATLYYSDFENLTLGGIKAQDLAWTGNGIGTVVIDSETGSSCLEITSDNGNLHITCNPEEGVSAKYDYAVSMRVKIPAGQTSPSFVFGTSLGSEAQGEYSIGYDSNGRVRLVTSNCDNPIPDVRINTGEWFDLAYTYNANPLNRRLLSLTFGDTTVECSEQITTSATKDTFKDFRNYTWANTEHLPYYIDDISISLVPRDKSKPGILEIKSDYNPIPYNESGMTLNLLNAGGRDFDYTATVTQGESWLKLSSYAGKVEGSETIKVTIDRKRLGYGFQRGIINFKTSEGENINYVIGVQSGNEEEGYVLYASNFNDLLLSEVSETNVVNELSSQDGCWDRVTDHNKAAVVEDPINAGEKCVKLINVNDWTKYCGYLLNVNAPAEAADDYDIVIGMQLFIPDTYVDLPEEYEHTEALFFVSQDNAHRQNEIVFYLDQTGDMTVQTELLDITNTNWWNDNRETAEPVPNNTWFNFYERLNTKLIDFDHKTLYAYNFGENEYQMEGDNQTITYPNGISEQVLANEALPTIKFWSYRDNANVLVKDVSVALVPKGAIPEPAFLIWLALSALAFARKQR